MVQLVAVGLLSWMSGYLQVSILVPVIMLLVTWFNLKAVKDRDNDRNVRQTLRSQDLWDDPDFLKRVLKNIPRWVKSADWERGIFLQQAVHQAWEPICQLVDVVLRTYVDPILNEVKPEFLAGLKFGKIDLGESGVVVLGLKNVASVDEGRIILDIRVELDNAEIELEINPFKKNIRGFTAGIRDIHIKGTFRIVLHPLIGDIPFLGGIGLGFAEKPKVDFVIRTVGMSMNSIPGLEFFLEHLVEDLIEQYFCWPNDFYYSWVDYERVTEQLPLGLLELQPLEAKNLPQSTQLFSKPDPFCEVTIHGTTKRTRRKKNTYRPNWRKDSPMEFMLVDLKNSVAHFEVFDGGNFGELRIKMGHCRIDLGSDDWDLASRKNSYERWLSLDGTLTGEILVQIRWHSYHLSLEARNSQLALAGEHYTPSRSPSGDCLSPLSATSRSRTSPSARSRSFGIDSDGHLRVLTSCYSGLLVVEIKRARDLPNKRLINGPAPYVTATLKSALSPKQHKTVIRCNTINPMWNEKFHMKVADYRNDVLQISIFDSLNLAKDINLGNASLRLKKIASRNCLIDGWCPLDGERGKILVKVRFLPSDN